MTVITIMLVSLGFGLALKAYNDLLIERDRNECLIYDMGQDSTHMHLTIENLEMLIKKGELKVILSRRREHLNRLITKYRR